MRIPRYPRSTKRGIAVLYLVGAAAGALAIAGVTIAFVNLFFADQRQLQTATDSGALNVAKDALCAISVPLVPSGSTGQVERDNFGYLTDSSGNINLLAYNRMVGQATMVALNSQAEGTDAAKGRALQIQAIVGLTGKALQDALSPVQGATHVLSNSILFTAFNDLPDLQDARVQFNGTAYVEAGDSSNIFIPKDPSGNPIYPHDASGTIVQLPSSLVKEEGATHYLRGYTNLQLFNIGRQFSAVPVFPDHQPHLVSLTKVAHSPQLLPPDGIGQVPPNVYLSFSESPGAKVTAQSAAQVGALHQTFGANFSKGFIVLKNLPGAGFSGPIPGGPDILDNLLVGGLYCGAPNQQTGRVAYTRSPALYQQWADYISAHPNSVYTPPFPPAFDEIDSMHVDITTVALIKPQPTFVTFQSTDDPVVAPTVATMFNEWTSVYSPDTPATSAHISLTDLMSLETFKALVMSGRAQVTNFLIQNPGFANNTFRALVNAPTGAAPGVLDLSSAASGPLTTGLKLFDFRKLYPGSASGTPRIDFGQAGTPFALLMQCNDSSSDSLSHQTGPYSVNDILNQLLWRCQQIQPSFTMDDLLKLLGNGAGNPVAPGQLIDPTKILAPGETAYIYLDSNTKSLILSKTPPTGLSQNALTDPPDGPKIEAGRVYSATFNSVDTIAGQDPGDCGVQHVLFATPPSNGAFGQDTVTFTPNSGAGNNLGTLSFSQITGGGGIWTTPN